jgi:uncharacterized protein involved in outer membrane biogenesis
VVAIAAYAVLLLWYDGERIRSVVAERMMSQHGIALHIEQVERSFAPRPLVRLAGLRVANAGRPDHELVEIGTASFRIHPLSLILGYMTLDDVVVDGLRIVVPVNKDGALYWDPLVAAVSEWLHEFDWSLPQFEIRNLQTESRNITNDNDFLVSARRISGTMARPAELAIVASDVTADLETTLPLRLTGTATLKRVELGRQQGDLPVTLEAEGSVGDKALSIEASGGNLLDGDPMERDPLQARIALGDTIALLNGTMSRDDMTHLDLFVSLDKRGKDGEPDLHAELNLSDPDTHWRLAEIRASLGESTLAGDVEIANQGERRFFGGTLSVANVHYPEEEDEPEPDGPTLSDVLPDGDLYSNLLDFSQEFDADVRFDAENSTFMGVLFGELTFHALLQRGTLAAAIEKAHISDAVLSATFSVTPEEAQTFLELEASLRDAPLAALVAGLDTLDGVTGQFDGEISLRAAGEQTQAVLDSTAGRLLLFLEDGAMPDKLATRIAGDVFTAMFADFDKDDTIPIYCALADFSVDRGVARSQQMIVDTDEFNLYGKGEIHLGEQHLDIELVPRAKDFSLVSMRLPLRFQGPFDDVKFNPDVSEGVASLLTPIELGREGDSNCAPPPSLSAVKK